MRDNAPNPPLQLKTLIIACGALSHELVDLVRLNGWSHLELACLPAQWHHTPEKIPEGLRHKIQESRANYNNIYVMYGDCGTGGRIDTVLAEEGVERIPGPHCFSFLMGNSIFEAASQKNITTFYLTDFFCRFFEKFVWEALGLDRRDDMVEFVFGNYTKLVFMTQTRNLELEKKAREIAARLNLEFEFQFTGYGDMESVMKQIPLPVAN